jgi:hypothetical protein
VLKSACRSSSIASWPDFHFFLSDSGVTKLSAWANALKLLKWQRYPRSFPC